MGLFRKAAGSDEQELTPADAFAGIAMCAMYADGVMSAEEDDELAVYLAKLAVFRDLSDREMSATFQRVHALAAKQGDAALLETCAAALPDRLRPTAFLVAAELVMADGDVGEDERGFLKRIQQRLAVDDATAAKVVEVVRYKHVV